MATSVTLKPNAIDISGSTSGTTTLQATAVAGTTTLTLPAATDTLVGKATTDTLTNKTLTGAVMNGTLGATTPSTVAATTLTTSSTVTHNGGTANGVAYLNGSKVLTTGSALVFDGTTFTAGTATSQNGVFKTVIGSGGANEGAVIVSGTTGTGWLGFNNGNNANIPGQITYNHSTGALSLYANSGPVIFSASGTEGMRLDANGNLVVASTSASYSSSGRGNITIGGSSNSMLGFQVGGAAKGYVYHNGTDMFVSNDANGILGFYTNATERARIDSSGNLLVGTTGLGTIGSSSGFQITSSGAIYSSSTGDSVFSRRSANGTVITFRRDTTTVGSIDVTTTATSYVTSSDYRLKNTIAPMTGALAKVAALKPVTYKWNADGSDGEGFIAHELAEVVPQCVTGEKDAVDADGNPKYQGIDTSFLVATLTAAIQEQQALITQLTARITALEGA
jgi:hypothetical protein